MDIVGYHNFDPVFGTRHCIQAAGAVSVTKFVSLLSYNLI